LKRVLTAGMNLGKVFAEYQDMLDAMGLGDLLNDPNQLRSLLETLKGLKEALEANGFGEFLKNPKGLADFLSRYNEIKKAFDEAGLGDLLEDPYSARGFLKNYCKLREAFEAAGLEYLMDSPGAMRDFLAKNAANAGGVEDAKQKASRLDELERLLAERDAALERERAENARLSEKLGKYESLGTVEDFEKLKHEVVHLRHAKVGAGAVSAQVQALQAELDQKEQDRLDALERERFMFTKYKELDIFKLDVIARELKAILKKVEVTEKECKQLKDDANKLKDFGDRRRIEGNGNGLQERCKQTEAHIHDVIFKCLSETQRRHIGIASDNEHRADDRKDGRLLEGGAMLYSVEEGMEAAAMASIEHIQADRSVPLAAVERTNYGSSHAAKVYRHDDIEKVGGKR